MLYRILAILTILFSVQFNTSAQEEWLVPEDKKSKLSTFEFTPEVTEAGKQIYSTNCASCHGEPGKNNFVALVPPPGDPGSADFQTNTDGELYHKVREGRGTMPSFKNTLTPDDVWSVIAYIRSGNNSYVQEVAKEIQRGAYDGEVSITLATVDDKTVKATVTGSKDGSSEAIEGAAVKLSVNRMFGKLAIDEEKITNKNGEALFSLAEAIPGDAEGNIELIAQLSDQEAFGVIENISTLPLGLPVDAPSLVAERAIWNKMAKAPIWMILGYSITVLAAWGTIFYILFQFRAIFMIGKEAEE